MTIWFATSALLMGFIIAVIFWPELTCWLPNKRQERFEGYCDGMGGKPSQAGRSDAYRAGWAMGIYDCNRLRSRPKRRAF